MSRSHGIQMLEGSLWKNIFFFSVPLMFAQILEVLFNLSDVAVVGKFSSSIALGAVGSTTILVTLYTGFIIGMGSGVTVIVAHSLGQGNEEHTRKSIFSALVACGVVGIVICLCSFLLTNPLLNVLSTKEELFSQASLYLKIYSLGFPAMAIYNYGNGVLSACGDTKRPLLYLSVAGVLNVIMNLFFVVVCHKAADGVAIASVIAQYISALLIVLHLLKREDICQLRFQKELYDPEACKDILKLGIPAGIQNAIFAIANLFVQKAVNSFDATVVSGNSAAANADTIVYNVLAAFHTGCSSFVSKNWGAGKSERMLKSYFVALVYSFSAGVLLGGIFLIFGQYFLALFTNDADVIVAGSEKLKVMAFSYCLSSFMDCTIAASRGMGKSIMPMIIVILGSCVFRVVWVYTIFVYFHSITALYLLYPCSWTLTAIAEIVYFFYSYKKVKKIMEGYL